MKTTVNVNKVIQSGDTALIGLELRGYLDKAPRAERNKVIDLLLKFAKLSQTDRSFFMDKMVPKLMQAR